MQQRDHGRRDQRAACSAAGNLLPAIVDPENPTYPKPTVRVNPPFFRSTISMSPLYRVHLLRKKAPNASSSPCVLVFLKSAPIERPSAFKRDGSN